MLLESKVVNNFVPKQEYIDLFEKHEGLLYSYQQSNFKIGDVIRNTKNKFVGLKIFFSNLAGFSICLHLCFIYFISAIHKIHADVWFNGVATYYTFNIERFKKIIRSY